MKKYILITLLSILVLGCKPSVEPVYEKPFIIVDIWQRNAFHATYTYQDVNGNTNSFSDFANKYSIGDSIK